MSQAPFGSIFTIPIDAGENLYSFSTANNNKLTESKKLPKKKESPIDKDELIKENGEFLIFSNCQKNPNIKSKADSSKIYMSEFLKHNWKIKCKRFLIKMQKKYMKKAVKVIDYENNKNNHFDNNLIISDINMNNYSNIGNSYFNSDFNSSFNSNNYFNFNNINSNGLFGYVNIDRNYDNNGICDKCFNENSINVGNFKVNNFDDYNFFEKK